MDDDDHASSSTDAPATPSVVGRLDGTFLAQLEARLDFGLSADDTTLSDETMVYDPATKMCVHCVRHHDA